MAIELTMPSLSPTMEEGTLAKWMVREGDRVKPGDILAEIQTDKATMEFEAGDEGVITTLLVAEGAEGVKVGATIALLSSGATREGEVPPPVGGPVSASGAASTPGPDAAQAGPAPAPPTVVKGKIDASPLAFRLAEARGLDLTGRRGGGPGGRIVRADLGAHATARAQAPALAAQPSQDVAALAAQPSQDVATTPVASADEIPHQVVKLSSMRKTIARRLTESKQQIPHIYLTVDICLDPLLALRLELNTGLATRGIKLSINDLLIKALALSLLDVPECNVSFGGNKLIKYDRADIAVAVSIEGGLITPVVTNAGVKAVGAISREMGELADRARQGKLQPREYQGGTASLSNMGMYGIKNFQAVINPPQAMIMAVGAGRSRSSGMDDGSNAATLMSATGSFDHRAVDGADAARLMNAFRQVIEAPLRLVL